MVPAGDEQTAVAVAFVRVFRYFPTKEDIVLFDEGNAVKEAAPRARRRSRGEVRRPPP
ncbi:hypothetical protein ACTWP5_01440 [Streptomyces sp. 4N509B]|uniref:hypothetical protein n=1 Tax=Streptomyces sp. 4N509B TaxID=3457413 RepID=UPI003FD3F97F